MVVQGFGGGRKLRLRNLKQRYREKLGALPLETLSILAVGVFQVASRDA